MKCICGHSSEEDLKKIKIESGSGFNIGIFNTGGDEIVFSVCPKCRTVSFQGEINDE